MHVHHLLGKLCIVLLSHSIVWQKTFFFENVFILSNQDFWMRSGRKMHQQIATIQSVVIVACVLCKKSRWQSTWYSCMRTPLSSLYSIAYVPVMSLLSWQSTSCSYHSSFIIMDWNLDPTMSIKLIIKILSDEFFLIRNIFWILMLIVEINFFEHWIPDLLAIWMQLKYWLLSDSKTEWILAWTAVTHWSHVHSDAVDDILG